MSSITFTGLKERVLPSKNKGQASTVIIFFILVLVMFLLTDVFHINNAGEKRLFLTESNIKNVLNQVSINAVIAFGMTLVILVNGIDLSVGSIVAIAGVLTSIFFKTFQLPLAVSYILVLLVGGLVGSSNGLLVSKFKLPPFIVTLATMIVFRGFAFILSDGKAMFIPEPEFKIIGNSFIGIFPVSVLVMLACFAFVHIMLSRTTLGRKMYLTGGNEESALFSGININRVRITAYALVGFLSSVSGILLASRLGSGSPNVGVSYELDAIAAVVIGGTSFSGGIGTITGTLIGALILGIISNGMNMLGISPYMQYIVKGLVILGAVILDKVSNR